MNRNTFNVLIFLKKSKILRNGEHPLYCRITMNGTRAEFSLAQSSLPEYWDQKAQRAIGKSRSSNQANYNIDQDRANVIHAYQELKSEGKVFTALEIKNRFLGVIEKPIMILELYDEHNQKMKTGIGISYSLNTHKRHCTARDHLARFIKKRCRVDDLPVKSINNALIRDFESYFRIDRSCNNNSTVKYLKNFRKIINYALANDWISKDPFTGIKFHYEKTDRPYLTFDELSAIENKNLPIERISIVRDIFLFC